MKSKRVMSLAMGLLPAALMAQSTQLNLPPNQQTLVAEIPTSTAERAREIFTDLGSDIDTLVPTFAMALTTEKSDTDTTARYALGGLVWTIGSNGSAEQKKKLANLLADAVDSATGTEPKSFLIEQLQFLGEPSVADRILRYIGDPELGPRTIRTLSALKPKDIGLKFMTGLEDAPTTEVKAALLLALGDSAPANAAAKLAVYAKDDNIDVREAALNTLADIGDERSREILQDAATKSATFYDQLAGPRYLNYAGNLANKGNVKLAAEICREVISSDLTSETVHLRGLALTVLTDILKEKSLDDLFDRIADDEEDIRATALVNINRFSSKEVTSRLVAALKKSPDSEVAVAILLALGDRKDDSTLTAVSEKFKDDDPTVASTAVDAASEIDRTKALPSLLSALNSDTLDKGVQTTIKNQLLKADPDILLPSVGKALAKASPTGAVILIEVLGERRAASQKSAIFEAIKSESAPVRSAAYDALGRVAEAEDLPRLSDMMLTAEKNSDRTAARKAFTAAAKESQDGPGLWNLLKNSFDKADDKGKETLLEAMAAIANKDSLALVVDTAETSGSEVVQDAAVRSLSDWQSLDAMQPLMQIMEKSKIEKHQVLAVRGLIRLAEGLKSADEKVELLQKVLAKANRPDEQKTIITGLASVPTLKVLKLVAPYLSRDGLSEEAAAAVVKIAVPTKKGGGLQGAEVAEILKKALPAISDKDQRATTHKYIYELIRKVYATPYPVDDEGFSVLFNGKDLTGWCGDTDGYSVENGVLVCKAESGGKLFTEKEFGDFVLRLEFKLPPGANNGVGIRTPISGDPAYSGMEVQILDDKDPRYKDIKDWQRHGSVYGVSPARDSQLKLDEWNTEEISVIGRKIKVTLNGTVINEVDLDEAKAKGFPSEKAHPGVDRNQGHIGFLGHGHKVEFRNIRLKNVANDNIPEGFQALFNGKDLDGWKGLVADPLKRKAMSEEKLKEEQAKADEKMNAHWSVENGILYFDGEGSHLCTTKDYANFEMLVDWCIVPYGDNGIYLRGTPQVQIWDPAQWPQGSGGLYNNQKGTSDPLVMADNPIGQWNQFRIKMVDEKVTVHLNDKLVVDDVTLENYWDRKLPIFPTEQIELQSHGSPAWFRNVYIKELP